MFVPVACWLVCGLAMLLSFLEPAESMVISRMPHVWGNSVRHRHISTRYWRVQNRIVKLHDLFRAQVRPAAANMLAMKWHSGAARNAHQWAHECKFLTHNPAEDRAVPRFDQCGQNIFVSTMKVPWLFVLRSWYVEHQNFTYGGRHNDAHAVGHYTQMVWAATHRVGCAVAKCSRGGPRGKPFYNYVCDYCPAGNYPQMLAEPYKSGPSCSACRSTCRSKLKLCTNACPVANTYSNCEQLYSKSPEWLCGRSHRKHSSSAHNSVAIFNPTQRDKCLATCTCRGKIYD